MIAQQRLCMLASLLETAKKMSGNSITTYLFPYLSISLPGISQPKLSRGKVAGGIIRT